MFLMMLLFLDGLAEMLSYVVLLFSWDDRLQIGKIERVSIFPTRPRKKSLTKHIIIERHS